MRSPGHREHPEHHVTEKPAGGTWQACLGERVLAESDDVLEVDEDGAPPRFYFPQDALRADALQRTQAAVHCPYKGDGVYWSLQDGDRAAPQAAFSYDRPYDEHPALAGRVAFWPEKVGGLQVRRVH
ncbi:MAG TPA: DUF427 domain-containing protein [Burkholderiaceae bacterium]